MLPSHVAMAWLKRSRFRRTVAALAAVIFASGLLHGASMIITPASACHTLMTETSSGHAAHEHGSQVPGDPSPSSDDGMPAGASSCPFANVTSIATPTVELIVDRRALRLSTPAPRRLVSAVLDPPDPPPRHAA